MRILLALLGATAAWGGVVLDRIAVTVGRNVITETEIEQEIRVTALLNGEEPNFSPDSRRAAAARMVDQALIRSDMRLSQWPQPPAQDAFKLLDQIKRDRFGGDAGYRQALTRYGITEADLMEHLRWQVAALRYTESRFRPGIPVPGAAAPLPRTDDTGAAPAVPATQAKQNGNVDDQMDAWLKDARSRVRVVYHEDAFR
ncbi:MAG TPA: hypothetical protein VHA11_14615 [Bryobacteraceae bacterium]|nr:hypothetical protein [Bryobacteraceae bacterium]